MEKKTKKLQLRKETIAVLNEEMSSLKGGVGIVPWTQDCNGGGDNMSQWVVCNTADCGDSGIWSIGTCYGTNATCHTANNYSCQLTCK